MKRKNNVLKLLFMMTLTLVSALVIVACTPSNTDKKDVESAKAALEIGFTAPDTKDSVTLDVTLPTSGEKDVTITWQSSHPSVVSTAGEVTRPANDTSVTLTATLKKGEAFDTKNFTVKVIASEETITPEDALDALEISGDTLEASGAIYTTASDVVLPTESLGYNINWVSPSSALTVAGVVTRPAYGENNEIVVLTASIGDEEREFIIHVLAETTMPVDQVLTAAHTQLLIPNLNVAEDVTLPTTIIVEGLGEDEMYTATVTWETSDADLMTNEGKITRPALGESDEAVTMTATILYEGETREKEFSFVVLAELEPYEEFDTYAEAQAYYIQMITDEDGKVDESKRVYIQVNDVSVIGIMSDGLSFVDSAGDVFTAFGSTGNAYNNAQLGQRYDVLGNFALYFGAVQINGTGAASSRQPTVLKAKEGPALEPTPTEVSSITDYLPATMPTYSATNVFPYEYIRVTAKVHINNADSNYNVFLVDVDYDGDFSDINLISSQYTRHAIVVYYSSNKDELLQLDGLQVELDLLFYGLRDDKGIYNVLFLGTIDDVEVEEISDADAVAKAKASILADIPTVIPTTREINLRSNFLQANIAWETSHETLINLDGLVMPADDRIEVTLTATITAGTETEVVEIKVMVGLPPISSVEAVLAMDDNAPLRTEVTIIGYSANNTLIAHDGTHAIALFIGGGTAESAATTLRGAFGKRVVILGSRTTHNGLKQVQNITSVETLTTAAHTPLSVDITELTWNAETLLPHQSKLVSITGGVIENKTVDQHGNIVVTVKVGDKTINVRWDARIAITGTNVLEDAEIGDLINVVNAPLGWNQNAPQIGYYVSGQAVVTINPDLDTFTVTFMDGETELGTEDVVEGRNIKTYPATAKDGFTFLGWFTDATFDTPWVDGPITENVTLYASYEELSGTLVVDTYNFGSLTESSSYVTEPTDVELNGVTFTRMNANISTQAASGRGIVLGIRSGNSWGSPYLFVNEKLVGAYKVVFDISNWTNDAHFNLDDFAEGIYIQTSTDGTTWVDGTNFKETWNKDASATNKIELLLEEDVYVRLYVRSAGTQESDYQLRLIVRSFEVHSYVEMAEPVQVTFDPNYDDEKPIVVTIESGETVTAQVLPTRSGYKFLGWFEPEATEEFDFDTVLTADLALEARWEEIVVELETIAEASASADGTLVKIVGVVTGFSDFNATHSNYDKVFLEDETGAIQVWRGAFHSDLAVGDKYEVEGEIDIYNGQVQIAQGATLNLVDKGNAVSAPTDVTDVATVVALDQSQRVNFVGTFVSVTSNGRDMVLNVGGTNITVRSQSSSDSHPVNVHFLTGQAGQIVTVSAAHIEWATSVMRALVVSSAQVTFTDPTDAEILLTQQTILTTYFDGNSFNMDTAIAPTIDLDGTVVDFVTLPENVITVDDKWAVVTEDTTVVITITLTRGEEAPVEFDVEVTILFVEPSEPVDEEIYTLTVDRTGLTSNTYTQINVAEVNGTWTGLTNKTGDNMGTRAADNITFTAASGYYIYSIQMVVVSGSGTARTITGNGQTFIAAVTSAAPADSGVVVLDGNPTTITLVPSGALQYQYITVVVRPIALS